MLLTFLHVPLEQTPQCSWHLLDWAIDRKHNHVSLWGFWFRLGLLLNHTFPLDSLLGSLRDCFDFFWSLSGLLAHTSPHRRVLGDVEAHASGNLARHVQLIEVLPIIDCLGGREGVEEVRAEERDFLERRVLVHVLGNLHLVGWRDDVLEHSLVHAFADVLDCVCFAKIFPHSELIVGGKFVERLNQHLLRQA